MHKLIIIGDGAQARVASNILVKQGFQIQSMYGAGADPELLEYLRNQQRLGEECRVHIGIGDNLIREQLVTRHTSNFIKYVSAVSSESILETGAIVGDGSFIGPFAYLGLNSALGSHSILNTSAILDHDVVVGDFSHIGGNSYVAGNVTIGSNVFIGAGSTIVDGVEIASKVTIGAGAVVVKSIMDPGTYVGVPAKRIS